MIADLVALFGAGVASFLAPCCVPLVPAYLGIITGEAAGGRDARRAVPATAVFVWVSPRYSRGWERLQG